MKTVQEFVSEQVVQLQINDPQWDEKVHLLCDLIETGRRCVDTPQLLDELLHFDR